MRNNSLSRAEGARAFHESCVLLSQLLQALLQVQLVFVLYLRIAAFAREQWRSERVRAAKHASIAARAHIVLLLVLAVFAGDQILVELDIAGCVQRRFELEPSLVRNLLIRKHSRASIRAKSWQAKSQRKPPT